MRKNGLWALMAMVIGWSPVQGQNGPEGSRVPVQKLALTLSEEATSADSKKGEMIQLTKLSPLVSFFGRNQFLLWSEEHGYVEATAKRGSVDYSKLGDNGRTTLGLLGEWNEVDGRRKFAVKSVTMETAPLSFPRVAPRPMALDVFPDQVTRVTLEGEVRFCLERGYLAEILLDIDGEPIFCTFRNSNSKIHNQILAGQRIRVTGYLWNAHRTPGHYPIELVATEPSDIEFLTTGSEEPPLFEDDPVPSEYRRFSGMRYVGQDVEGWRLFQRQEPPLYFALDLKQHHLTHHDLARGIEYEVTAAFNQEHRGYLRGNANRLKITQTGFPPLEALELSGDHPPLVGTQVRIRGQVKNLLLRENGHLLITLNDETGQPLATGISKSHLANRPTLDLRTKDWVELSGTYQGVDERSGRKEVLIEAKNTIAIYSPQRPGRAWKPLLFTMSGVLGACFLWVAMLRRAVRQRTRQVKRSEDQLMAVYQSVPHGIIAVDAANRVFGINRALEEVVGLDSDFEGKPFAEVAEAMREKMEDPEAWSAFVSNMETEPEGLLECTIEGGRAGKTRCIEVQVEPIDRGETSGALWLIHDLTDKRALEATLAHSQKLEAIGRLTGGIAHDFNNLLTGVTGSLSLLELDKQSSENREYINSALTASDHASNLIHQLLDYSRQSKLEMRVCSVNEILGNLHHLLRHAVNPKVVFDLHLDNELFSTRVDPVKIEQVLMNLIMNAIDAMPSGGRVTVQTKNGVGVDGKDIISISVTDTGRGISQEIREQIFEPYFTTKEADGNGLGLSTSLAVIEQHEGQLTCTSEVGIGTTFTIELPAIRQRAEILAPEKLRANLACLEDIPAKVVVIDDEPVVLRMMKAMLTRKGFDVSAFASGEEALVYLESSAPDVDLIISDNSMPIMDGKQVFRSVRELYPKIPFIVTSGYLVDLEDYGKLVYGSSPEAFIPKPLSLESFTEAVRQVIGESSQSAA